MSILMHAYLLFAGNHYSTHILDWRDRSGRVEYLCMDARQLHRDVHALEHRRTERLRGERALRRDVRGQIEATVER